MPSVPSLASQELLTSATMAPESFASPGTPTVLRGVSMPEILPASSRMPILPHSTAQKPHLLRSIPPEPSARPDVPATLLKPSSVPLAPSLSSHEPLSHLRPPTRLCGILMPLRCHTRRPRHPASGDAGAVGARRWGGARLVPRGRHGGVSATGAVCGVWGETGNVNMENLVCPSSFSAFPTAKMLALTSFIL